ncbi:MAG: 4-oxalocrotonate tautomerase family protein [Halanaerobiales bacterium]|nr:4-oxalocrotonate tautomerase family protein [Halanaerobiales bacterium]
MPVINIDGIGGNLSRDQKRELVKELTKKTSEITGISESAFTVLIKEMDYDNIGGGGKLLSDIKNK